jgi:hypothetical protein
MVHDMKIPESFICPFGHVSVSHQVGCAVEPVAGEESVSAMSLKITSLVLFCAILLAVPCAGQNVPGIPGVAPGDTLTINGFAAGASRAAVWIFGQNKLIYDTVTPDQDGTFAYTLGRGTTSALSPGEYFVVIQHPGPLGTFEVIPGPDLTLIILNAGSPGSSVRIGGLGAQQAANALVTALNSPFIDDTYTTLSFQVTSPQVFIDPIGQVVAGTPLFVSGTTNLAPGDRLMVSVYSSAFTPTMKGQEGQFYGASGSVIVQPGAGGTNTWSYRVDTSSFAPGRYSILVEGIEVQAGDSAIFNLVPVTPAPTPVITSATPTTPVPVTTEPVTTPVPTTTRATGFGLFLATAGVAAVAILLGKGNR